LAEADAILCSGPFDDRRETGEDYRERLQDAAIRKLPMVCANPDLHVHVGPDLLPCAGAIAQVYEGMGGPVFWAGKPHPIAYATALAMAEAVREEPVRRDRVLAIGDAVRTDLAAAAGAGVEVIFIATGIHRDAIMVDGAIDPARMAHEFEAGGFGAKAAMTSLRW
jgi:HAD superfamily hydrolase (TIGR01459 family)